MPITASPLLSSFRKPSVLPGFGGSLGLMMLALSLIVLIPLASLVLYAASIGPHEFFTILSKSRVLAALGLSFGTALVAAAFNSVFGLILAWVLVRYRFPGRRLLDATIDLPFALPTAVAGIALATLYDQNGLIGQWAASLGWTIAYSRSGIILALMFVGLPFVVRMVEPLLQEIEPELEEAAALLGASRWRVMRQIILPHLWPGLISGFAMGLARGVGEYGSLIFIAGNVPYQTEIAPLLIVIRLEEFDYAGATVIATVMLVISFTLILAINRLVTSLRRSYGYE